MVVAKTDAELKREVEQALRSNLRLDARHIEVVASRGVVHLRGTVPNEFQRREAVAATFLLGVPNVVDELRVEPAEQFRDHDVRYQVESALVRDHRVNEKDVSVEVRDGIVELTGLVDTPAQKHFAQEDIWPLPGVAGVQDRMATVPLPDRPDREIVQDVTESLSSNPWIDTSKLAIRVRKQVVDLVGSVPSREQKRLAEAAARWVRGVRDVRNRLTIEEQPSGQQAVGE